MLEVLLKPYLGVTLEVENQSEVKTLIHYQTEDGLRHSRGPVQQTIRYIYTEYTDQDIELDKASLSFITKFRYMISQAG